MRRLFRVLGERFGCQINCLHDGISRDSALETVDNIIDGTTSGQQVQCTGYFDSRVFECWSAATDPGCRNNELSQRKVFVTFASNDFSNFFSPHSSISFMQDTSPSYSKYA